MELKERILRTTYSLMSQYGLSSVTMDIIAKECGISKRTLYENFSDKNTLAIESIQIMYEERARLFQDILDNSDNLMISMLRVYLLIRDFMVGMCPSFFMDMDRLYPLVAQRYKEMENDHIERFTQMLTDGQKEGVFRDDINPLIIAPLCVGQLQSMKKTKYMLLEQYSAVEIFDSMFLNFLRGIATQKGLKIIDDFVKENNREQK